MNVTIDLELVLIIFTLLGIVFGAVGFMFKLYKGYESNIVENKAVQTKFTYVLDQLVNEVSELKNYGPRIEQNEKDILSLKKEQESITKICELRHSEKGIHYE